MGEEQLDGALLGCDVVVIPAGVPRKPGIEEGDDLVHVYVWSLISSAAGMTRDDLFNTNASIVRNLVEACTR